MNIDIRLVWRRVLDWNRWSHLAWQLPPWSRKLWFYLCKVSWYWLWRNEMEAYYSQNPSLQAWTLQSICMNKCTILALMQSSICWLFGCKYNNLCNFESISVQLLESMLLLGIISFYVWCQCCQFPFLQKSVILWPVLNTLCFLRISYILKVA